MADQGRCHPAGQDREPPVRGEQDSLPRFGDGPGNIDSKTGAGKNFVAVAGDKEIANITHDDILDFRQHWLDRIEAGEVTANSANKDLIHLGDVLKTVNTMKRLGLSLPLGELSFKAGEKQTRPPVRRCGA